MKTIKLNINNKVYEVAINESDRLIDVLRDKLHLTGTKEGCSEGECGACSVIMDKQIVNSCLVMAFQAAEKEIITIEGVEYGPIQEAFVEVGAVQCGYCIPGMVLSAKAFLDKNQNPNKEEIKKAISGNLCRCTGYTKIIEAIYKASKEFDKSPCKGGD